MAAKIVKTEKLLRPACRLTGLRYTEADRKNGSFSHKWAEWFSQGLFAPLEQAPPGPGRLPRRLLCRGHADGGRGL